MNLPRGSREKLSEFWNLKNVSCGDMTNGLYRHGYIDNRDDSTCIFSVRILVKLVCMYLLCAFLGQQ